MSLTYSQYVTNLANTLVVPSTDLNYLAELPNIIDDAEQRIYRELDLLSTIVRDTSGTLTPNSRNFTFPQHFISSEEVNIFAPAGSTTNRFPLMPTSKEFLNQVWANETPTTTPSASAVNVA